MDRQIFDPDPGLNYTHGDLDWQPALQNGKTDIDCSRPNRTVAALQIVMLDDTVFFTEKSCPVLIT